MAGLAERNGGVNQIDEAVRRTGAETARYGGARCCAPPGRRQTAPLLLNDKRQQPCSLDLSHRYGGNRAAGVGAPSPRWMIDLFCPNVVERCTATTAARNGRAPCFRPSSPPCFLSLSLGSRVELFSS